MLERAALDWFTTQLVQEKEGRAPGGERGAGILTEQRCHHVQHWPTFPSVGLVLVSPCQPTGGKQGEGLVRSKSVRVTRIFKSRNPNLPLMWIMSSGSFSENSQKQASSFPVWFYFHGGWVQKNHNFWGQTNNKKDISWRHCIFFKFNYLSVSVYNCLKIQKRGATGER